MIFRKIYTKRCYIVLLYQLHQHYHRRRHYEFFAQSQALCPRSAAKEESAAHPVGEAFMNAGHWLLQLLAGALDAAFIHMLAIRLFPKRKLSRRVRTAVLAALFCYTTLTECLCPHASAFRIAVIATLGGVYISLTLNAKALGKAYACLLLVSICLIGAFVEKWLCALIVAGTQGHELRADWNTALCLFTFYACLTACVVSMYKALPKRIAGISPLRMLALAAMEGAAVIVFAWRLYGIDTGPAGLGPSFYAWLGLLLFLFNIIIALALRAAVQSYEQALAEEELAAQIATLKREYATLEKDLVVFRSFRHDFTNHLMALRGLNDERDHLGLEMYLEQMSGRMPSSPILRSGNVLIDAIMNAKCTHARELGIELSLSVSVPETISIEWIDLCTLLSNAMDNAIEACEKVEPGKRRIEIHLQKRLVYLYFSISNSMAALPVAAGRGYATSKPSPAGHGIGLQNMRAVADKYNGYFKTRHDAHSFTLLCMLRNE